MSQDSATVGNTALNSEPVDFADFLASVPPGQRRQIRFEAGHYSDSACYVELPPFKTYCDNSHCQTECFFDSTSNHPHAGVRRNQTALVSYKCRHCKESIKIFALLLWSSSAAHGSVVGQAEKFGELPAFGPPTPARLNKLIGEDREFFFKGRRAEIQGMGIGAFGYYRRVVERQKDRILDEILRVSQRMGVSPTIVMSLEAARRETQFSRAVELVKDAIPDTLKINGHNPMLLLHSALSEGLHSQSDKECLELATSIRVVLAELAEKLGQALKEQAELENAVSRLLIKKSAQAGTASEKAGSG